LYSARDAARYLKLPVSTVVAWSQGTTYGTGGSRRRFEPVIAAAQASPLSLSFANLVEIHVLGSLRRENRLKLDNIRTALDYVQEKLNVGHPLIHQEFQTDGMHLFVEQFGKLINASMRGQEALREIVEIYLHRVEVDEDGIAKRLYPFTRRETTRETPRLVAIDPVVSYGRPFIVGRGVPTEVIADRYFAGDSASVLAVEYRCSNDVIEEAVRCEAGFREAA
jgi:uncharacterized protein (DUF433 family)